MPDHDLVFLGVEHVDHHFATWGEWIDVTPRDVALVACACGWTKGHVIADGDPDLSATWAERDHAYHAHNARRRAEEAALTDAACLYCFAPLETPGYCSDTHRLADRKRPDADVLQGVLSEFSDRDAIEPVPDQIALF